MQKTNFIKNNSVEYNDFIKFLQILRCNLFSFDKYLKTFSDDESIHFILNINNYYDYCKENNLPTAEPGAEELVFASLKEDNLEKILAVNNNEKLYICHPNEIIADPLPLNDDVDYLININWLKINPERMLSLKNYHLIKESKDDSINTIKEILLHEEKGIFKAFDTYAAIVSETISKKEYLYYIKAIIKSNFIGIEMAINENPKPMKLIKK